MTKRQKILVVCQHFWPESFRINDVCDFLVNEKNCEIDVLCGIPNYPKGAFFEGYSFTKNRHQSHNGATIRRVFEIPRGNNSNFRIFINYISFPIASIFHIPRLLAKKYDKILLYQLSPVMMSFAGIVVGKLTKTETTMYVLDLWPENLYSVIGTKKGLPGYLARSISHWHYKRVDKLVTLSDKMREKLIEVTRKKEDQIITLPQACEKFYEKDIKDPSLVKRFKKGFTIVFTGNISPAQSFGTIINAAKIIEERGIGDISWVIVGDGMSRKAVELEVRKNHLEDSFFFEGQIPPEEVPRYTTIADALIGCLVKSDLLEATIPAKVMSYIAAGKPVLLAMDGEVQTLINKTIRCGFASNTEDAKALAENIIKLHAMPLKARNEMGKRAKKYHFAHFERNIILSKLYDFIMK